MITLERYFRCLPLNAIKIMLRRKSSATLLPLGGSNRTQKKNDPKKVRNNKPSPSYESVVYSAF